MIKEDIMIHDALFQELERTLPPVFSRQVASDMLGGLISAKTLSNLDALGEGPGGKIKFGQKTGYRRDLFISWLKSRMNK